MVCFGYSGAILHTFISGMGMDSHGMWRRWNWMLHDGWLGPGGVSLLVHGWVVTMSPHFWSFIVVDVSPLLPAPAIHQVCRQGH